MNSYLIQLFKFPKIYQSASVPSAIDTLSFSLSLVRCFRSLSLSLSDTFIYYISPRKLSPVILTLTFLLVVPPITPPLSDRRRATPQPPRCTAHCRCRLKICFRHLLFLLEQNFHWIYKVVRESREKRIMWLISTNFGLNQLVCRV